MKKLTVTIYLFAILLFLFQSLTAQVDEDGWKLAKLKDGIEIYTRSVESSKIKEYKVITTITAEPKKLVEILMDVDSYTNWMAFVKETYLIDMPSKEEFYVYTEVKVPWPFKNRDDITKSVVSYDSLTGSYTVDIYLEPEYLPEKEGIVRMYEGGGLWRFTPLGDGETEAFHRFRADPGGNIPAWIVNMFLVDGPYKTMLGLKRFVGTTD